jgi:hypothetical protein
VTRRAAFRASDLDREHIADRLRHATAEGRLATEELEDRLEATFSARTYHQLHAVVSDLPAARSEQPMVPVWARASLAVAGAVGVLAAAAAAALLFAVIAGASAAWMLFGRVLARRGGHVRRGGHSRNRAITARATRERTGGPRGGRALLP